MQEVEALKKLKPKPAPGMPELSVRDGRNGTGFQLQNSFGN